MKGGGNSVKSPRAFSLICCRIAENSWFRSTVTDNGSFADAQRMFSPWPAL